MNARQPRLAEVIRGSALLRNSRHAKSLGQHFLTDPSLLARIVEAAGPLENQAVLEIGPGPGGLTREILKRGPYCLVAVEKDPSCVEALRPLAEEYSGTLFLQTADILTVDLADICQLADERPLCVIANLPYNVGTEILLKLLRHIHRLSSLTLMFQREVVDRILAPYGTKEYGRLSVLAQVLTTGRRVMTLPPGAFTPPPKVFSSVIHLTPKADVDMSLLPFLDRVTKVAFQSRRKMLRHSLLSLWSKEQLETTLGRCHISSERRPETLSLTEFLELATCLREALDARRR